MKRREVLTVGLAGFVLPNLVARATAAPCPPPSLQLDGQGAATSCASTSAASFRLTSAVGGTSLPFTFGQPFKQGDIPSGQFIGSNVTNFQADIRNRWMDGSVKFAVVSGRQSLTANTSTLVSMQATGTAPGGTNIAEPTPAYLAANVSVALSGSGAGTYTPQQAATNGSLSWNRSTAQKVRQFLGPVMSEFHYYTPTSDGHLTIWWYIRVYSDRTEVETAIEQGWTKVAGPVQKSYTVTVTVGGTQRYTATIAHRHHARWSRRDWIGTDPQITPAHDRAYLCGTKMVPNYAPITVGPSLLNSYVQSASPMTIGNFEPDGSETGAHRFLGILPEWEAAYVISGDVRAYRAMLANEQASNCAGLWYGPASGAPGFGFVQRDESSGVPVAPTDYSNESYNNRNSSNGGTIVVGSNSSGPVWVTDVAHSWAAGYLAYLTTGRWFSLETCQFLAASEFLVSSADGGNVRMDSHQQDRGCAWMMRTMAAATAITPDSSPLRSKMINWTQLNIAAWRSNEVGFNNLGIRRNVYDNTDQSPPRGGLRDFMNNFLTQAFAFGYHAAGDALSTASRTQFLQAAQFHCGYAAGKMGTRPGGFCYKSAAAYNFVCGPSPGSFYTSFAEMYDANVSAGFIPPGDTCTVGTALSGGNFPNATSYWGNFLPAAAYAVDLGVTGASAGYGRVSGASNWASFYADLPNAPQWAVIPR